MLPRPAFALSSAAIVALAPVPLLALLPRAVAGHYDYAFAPVGVIAAILLARRRVRRIHAIWPGNVTIGRIILVCAAIGLLVAAVFRSPWGAAMSLLLIVAALAWDYGGRPVLRAVAPPLILIALCIPLPLDLDRSAVAFMSRGAGRWASHFLDLLGVAHVRSDQVLLYSEGRLDLIEQLGGPFSPFALAAFLLGVALAFGRGFWRTVILIVTGVSFLPIVSAVAAVVQIAWVGGLPNFVWAAGCSAVAATLAFSFDQWTGIPGSFALLPHTPPEEVIATAPARPSVGGGAIGRFAAAGFAGLALVQLWAVAAPMPPIPSPPEGWLPERVTAEPYASWTIDRTATPDFGFAAPLATYRGNEQQLSVSVHPAANRDGPPLADLEGRGWAVRSRTVQVKTDDPTAVVLLELPAERYAIVWVCGLTADGQKVAPPTPLFGPVARAHSALARAMGLDNGSAEWWVRGAYISPWLPTAYDTVEPAAVFRAVCGSLGQRLRAGGQP